MNYSSRAFMARSRQAGANPLNSPSQVPWPMLGGIRRLGRGGMNSNHQTPDRIRQLTTGYGATGILGGAASHSLFTPLEAGADTADQLAAEAGISERGAQTLLDGLVSLGLVELRDGNYRNTAE